MAAFDRADLASRITAILTAPGVDLDVVSAKAVRRQLADQLPTLGASACRLLFRKSRRMLHRNELASSRAAITWLDYPARACLAVWLFKTRSGANPSLLANLSTVSPCCCAASASRAVAGHMKVSVAVLLVGTTRALRP